jgi:hypothetical protein
LTTLPPSCADCLKIWEPQTSGTLKACNGIALPLCGFSLLLYTSSLVMVNANKTERKKKFMSQSHAILVKVSLFCCATQDIKLAIKLSFIASKQFFILKCDEASVLKHEKGNQT